MKCNTCGRRVKLREGVSYNGNFIHPECAITLSELYMKKLEKKVKSLEDSRLVLIEEIKALERHNDKYSDYIIANFVTKKEFNALVKHLEDVKKNE